MLQYIDRKFVIIPTDIINITDIDIWRLKSLKKLKHRSVRCAQEKDIKNLKVKNKRMKGINKSSCYEIIAFNLYITLTTLI